MENCLKNKVVIVTGSSSGIGEAIAVELVSQGAKVVIIGRREHKLKLVAARCELVGTKPLVIRADVTKDDDRRMIIKRTIKHFGKLNVLVNCAGVAKFISILSNEAIEMFDEVMSINLRSIVHLVHLSASYLIASKGSIINIGSVRGIAPIASENFSYCVSKAALHHFTKCLALELASKNVRVNLIAPGPVRTSFIDTMDINDEGKAKFLGKLIKGSALGKMVDLDEIAQLAAFFLSEKTKTITGSLFVIDIKKKL